MRDDTVRINPPVSMPSFVERAPAPPPGPSSSVTPYGSPRWSTPNDSWVGTAPVHTAMTRSLWRSLAASILASVTQHALVRMKLPAVVAFATPAGQVACTIVPGFERISIGCITPAGDQGMSQQSCVSTAISSPDTSPDQVQLISAGACGLDSLKSKTRRSPSLVIVTRQAYTSGP